MDLRRGPVIYGHGLRRRRVSDKRSHRRSAPYVLIIAGLALITHAMAGLTVLEAAGASQAPPVLQVTRLQRHTVVHIDENLVAFEEVVMSLRQDAQALTASLELRPALSPLPHDLRPAIAVIIDDVGLSVAHTRAAIALPVPVTLAFLPYGNHVQMLADEARAAGHEIFLHLPMEPVGGEDPGPDALVADLDGTELMARTSFALDQFSGYTGVNNHMGSRLTQDAGLRAEVMTLISARDVIFVDSLTSRQSLAYAVARAHGIAATRRDVFLDNDIDEAEINGQLLEAERIAQARGTAIAIAHPHEATLAVLEAWLEGLEAKGFEVVPVSEIIQRRQRAAQVVAGN